MKHTGVTALAAIEAERNEQMTLAAGAVAGERRVAWARLAMIAMFAFTVELEPQIFGGRHIPFDLARFLVGVVYTAFAITTILVLRRLSPDPGKAVTRGAIVTCVDFAFVIFQASMDIHQGFGMQPAMFAVSGAILITFTMSRITLWHVALAVAIAVVGLCALCAIDGHVGLQLVIFIASGFVALGVLIALTNRALRTIFRDLRRRDNLTRFLPHPVAERMLTIGPEALAPVQREVTVLFSDIRGFTSMSEALAPREVLELLDDYFGRMSQIVKGHDGVVGKFIGDGLLAFWNVPDRDPDHAAKAVRAALDMLRALPELEVEGRPPIKIGIGIHTGPVAAGMLGGPEQSEYTVIGDAVNVASRIEGLTKSLGAAVLVSEDTWQSCGDRFPGRRLAAEAIRGRKEPVVLFEVFAAAHSG